VHDILSGNDLVSATNHSTLLQRSVTIQYCYNMYFVLLRDYYDEIFLVHA
jgi:hypothetical protein